MLFYKNFELNEILNSLGTQEYSISNLAKGLFKTDIGVKINTVFIQRNVNFAGFNCDVFG